MRKREDSAEVRLRPLEWGIAAIVIAGVLCAIPSLWERVETIEGDPGHRLPYRLSNDYWMYRRYARAAKARGDVAVIGDSVIWGHYVKTSETLSHDLGEGGGGRRFANLGVDGIHPVAMEGLVRHHARAIRGMDVILHFNPLWMTSKRRDLQTKKAFAFNHPDLVPQFWPRIPCYRASLSERIGVVLGRHLPFLPWANHMRIAYFEDLDFPRWTVAHPYGNPGRAVTLRLPSADEPPSPEPDARPWEARGLPPLRAAWVDLATSLQWRAFRRAVATLRRRGNRVFVLVGPFNEHMLEPEGREVYRSRLGGIEAWLRSEEIPWASPPPLPSEEYADASHPLAAGYARLAAELLMDPSFRRVLGMSARPRSR